MRRPILIASGVGVSALLLWLALREADFEAIGTALSDAELTWALPFLLVLFVFYWMKSMRWRDLLSPAVSTSSATLFPIVMIGYAGTAVLPMQLGELLRTYIAARKFSLAYSLVLSSVFIERIFDLLTILALLALILLVGQSMSDVLVSAGYVIGAITFVGLVMSVLLVRYKKRFLEFSRRALSWLPSGIRGAIVHQLEAASDGLQSIRSPVLVMRVALNSIIQWALMGLCIWFSLLALDVQVPFSAGILVLVATIVGISLPTSPGYIGNIQLAFVVALQPFGIDAAHAVAASVFYHVLAYTAVVIVGFFFLHRQGLDIRSVEAEARASSESVD